MNGLDIVLTIILSAGLIIGFRKGFIKSLSGFIGIGLAIWIGFNFSNLMEGFVKSKDFIPDALVKIVSLVLTILLIILAVKILSKILHEVVHGVGLGFFNRLGGAVFGFLLYVMALSALIYYTRPFLLKMFDDETFRESKIIPYLELIATYIKASLF